MSRVGYARVSTADQDPTLQVRALEVAGCDRIFSEHVSGVKANRVELIKALDYCRGGDCLVVWRLDRLGRSVRHLVEVLNMLQRRDIGFISLTEQMNTTTPMGRLLFHVAASFAELERDIIRERTAAGIEAAKAGGRSGGRPRVLTEDALSAARGMRESGASVREIARALRVSTSTAQRAVADIVRS